MIEQEKELEGCTFEPEFYSKDYRFNQTLNFMAAGDVYDRNNMWRLQKDMKIDEQRFK